jgi:hypothetical protein
MPETKNIGRLEEDVADIMAIISGNSLAREGTLDEPVLELFNQRATDVNNGGMAVQVRTLLHAGWTVEMVANEALRDLSPKEEAEVLLAATCFRLFDRLPPYAQFRLDDARRLHPNVVFSVRARLRDPGERRCPARGEWYLSGAIPEAYEARGDMSDERHILDLALYTVQGGEFKLHTILPVLPPAG